MEHRELDQMVALGNSLADRSVLGFVHITMFAPAAHNYTPHFGDELYVELLGFIYERRLERPDIHGFCFC